ncbi:MAG: hypothetical protein GF401_08240 [Chitinivibrionales bacterium]|nr:hypothetical protein [Chitinivibrionales bacterium]
MGIKGSVQFLIVLFSATNLFSDILPYKIIDRQVLGSFVSSKIIMKIMVETEKLPLEEDIKETAKKIWHEGNTLWNNFTLFVYLPEMNNEGAAYCFLEFGHSGLQNFQIQEFSIKETIWTQKKEKDVEEIKEKEPKRQVLEYTLALKVKKKKKSRGIDILVVTNFPDSTNLELTVARPYYQRGKDEELFGILNEEVCRVKGGRIERSYTINDGKWYYKIMNQNEDLGKKEEDFARFKSISPRVKVYATYSPEIEQPLSVVNILGKNAEYVAGKGTGKIGYGKPYSVEKFTEIHFER